MKPELKLIGTDGNAFAILGKAMKVAKENGMDWNKIRNEATSGDYNHLSVRSAAAIILDRIRKK